VPVAVRYDPAFPEILQGPRVGPLLHVKQLLVVPLVEVGRLHERVNHTILAVFARAIDTQMHREVDGRPFGVFLLAVDTDLG